MNQHRDRITAARWIGVARRLYLRRAGARLKSFMDR
jgi:hypothetical protein